MSEIGRGRPHRLVVFGATSFVGQILCRTLVERIGVGGEVAWAIAGRDAAKLEQVAVGTGADVPRLVMLAPMRPSPIHGDSHRCSMRGHGSGGSSRRGQPGGTLRPCCWPSPAPPAPSSNAAS